MFIWFIHARSKRCIRDDVNHWLVVGFPQELGWSSSGRLIIQGGAPVRNRELSNGEHNSNFTMVYRCDISLVNGLSYFDIFWFFDGLVICPDLPCTYSKPFFILAMVGRVSGYPSQHAASISINVWRFRVEGITRLDEFQVIKFNLKIFDPCWFLSHMSMSATGRSKSKEGMPPPCFESHLTTLRGTCLGGARLAGGCSLRKPQGWDLSCSS